MNLGMVSLLFMLIFTANSAFAQAILQDVDTRFEGSTFVTELKFDKVPESKDILIEYINQTIQVNLPGATVKTGKLLRRVDQENVKSVYSYQFDKDLLRTRIIYSAPVAALNYEGFVKVERKDNSLLVNVYDPIMAKTAQQKPMEFEIVPPVDLERELNQKLNNKDFVTSEASAEDIVAKELDIPKTLPEKMNAKILDKKDSDTKANEAKVAAQASITKTVTTEDKLNLSEKEIPLFKSKEKIEKGEEATYSRLLYSLFIVVVFGLGLLVFAKWWAKNHKVNEKNTKIQVLSQHHLGPKKSLVIIRIAGESHLLGVTDYNINMLKTLSFIDDEVVEEVPETFVSAMNTEDSKIENEKYLPKMTFNPDSDLVADLHNQISGKLKKLKDI